MVGGKKLMWKSVLSDLQSVIEVCSISIDQHGYTNPAQLLTALLIIVKGKLERQDCQWLCWVACIHGASYRRTYFSYISLSQH